MRTWLAQHWRQLVAGGVVVVAVVGAVTVLRDDIDPRCRDANFAVNTPGLLNGDAETKRAIADAERRLLRECTERLRLDARARDECAALTISELRAAYSVSVGLRDGFPVDRERELLDRACYDERRYPAAPLVFADVPLDGEDFAIPFLPSPPNTGDRSALIAVAPTTGEILWEREMPFTGFAHVFSVGQGLAFGCDCGPGSVLAGVASDGSASWMRQVATWRLREAIADSERLVVVFFEPSTGDEVVAALDARTGDTLWTAASAVPLAGDLPNLVLTGDVVIVVESETILRGLDARNGAEVWTTSLAASVGPPFADDAGVLVPSGGGLVQIEPSTGDVTQLVQPPTSPEDAHIEAVVARFGDLLGVRAFVPDEPRANLVGAIELGSQEPLWVRRLNKRTRPIWGTDTVLDRPFFDSWERARAWDLHTGDRIWVRRTETRRGIPRNIGALDGDVSYLVIDEQIHAISRSGDTKWTQPAPSHPAEPSVIDGLLLVPSATQVQESGGAGSLLAFDTQSGAIVWETTTGLPLRFKPIHHNGAVVVFAGYSEEGLI